MAQHGVAINLACTAFGISETCYRYQARRQAENEEIANWLVRLTDNNRNWGFGLCYLYLRNVKGFGWNHKRIYRIYRTLELNLRIKPKKRMVRERPAMLTVPASINQVWSMDFMHDQLSSGMCIEMRLTFGENRLIISSMLAASSSGDWTSLAKVNGDVFQNG